MDIQVLEDISYLSKKHKIPNDIVRKILKICRLRNEEREIYALKKLFNGTFSHDFLKLFCNYYEWGIFNLKELDTNLSFCDFCLEYHSDVAYHPDFKNKIMLLYQYYTRIDYQIPIIFKLITSKDFFQMSEEEIEFYLQVYFYVKSNCENGKTMFINYQTEIGTILENRKIKYALRKVFFDLTNSNYIFFKKQFWQLIWHRFQNYGYVSAIWTSLYLRERMIINSPKALEFIMNDDNIPLFSIIKDFFLSSAFTENNMYLINSLKTVEEKEKQIRFLINITFKGEKRPKIKINETDFMKKLYTGYLNEACSLTEVDQELKRVKKKNMKINNL